MTSEKNDSQKKTGFQFLVLYAVSLVLIFIVVTAFLKKEDSAIMPSIAQPSTDEKIFIQLDTLLHEKMQQLDKTYAAFLNSDRLPDNKEAANVFAEKKTLVSSIDSIENLAASLKDGSLKTTMSQLAAKFKTSFKLRDSVFLELVPLPKGKTTENVVNNNPSSNELEELKAILVEKEQKIDALEKTKPSDAQEKDRMIASLQNQLKQQQSIQNTSSNDGEWKQKYASLKQGYDKVSASEQSLKNAYKTVVDDNKRLISQLQSLRKN